MASSRLVLGLRVRFQFPSIMLQSVLCEGKARIPGRNFVQE